MEALSFIREIEAIFTLYWGGHFEVVETFFSRPRPREQLIAWLDLQLYKEIHIVPHKAQALIDGYDALDAGVDRSDYEAEAYELADEIHHYRLLADVRELITGEKLKASDAKPSPEQLRLEGLRQRYSASKSALVRSVSGFSAGGGVAFAAAGSMIDGGLIERRLADVFKVIHRQENSHYRQGRSVFDHLAEKAEPAEYSEAMDYARQLARQHFVLRNESFGYPLGLERVREIDGGKVVPYSPPVLTEKSRPRRTPDQR
jgi:hypothetical protein